SDPEPRCDAEGEDPRFPVLDDEAVALVLELLSRRPLLACRRHPLPLVVADRAQLWRRCRRLHTAGAADRDIVRPSESTSDVGGVRFHTCRSTVRVLHDDLLPSLDG